MEFGYQLGATFKYMHTYVQMHISMHGDLHCIPHVVVNATDTSTALQPCMQVKKCCISLLHLLPRHEELIHTHCTQKRPHEQTPPSYQQMQNQMEHHP